MEKDLFAIFPDLPSPRRVRPPVRQIVSSVEPPPSSITNVTRRRILMVNRETEILALRRIREIAQSESERLKPNDGLVHVLRTIVAVADRAIVASTSRSR
jgi:hypothetical protein